MRIRSRLFGLLAAVTLCVASVEARALSVIRDAEIERTLKQMCLPIFQAAGLGPESVELFIIQDRSLNAFVVGRNMAFHTGLLEQLETPEELYGVIAHETGHIAGGHSVARSDAVRSSTGPLILSTILGIAAAAAGAGDAGAAIIAGGQHVAQRGFLKYTRGQESSADQAGLTYLETAGVDPSGMIKTLKRLKSEEIVTIGRQDPYAYTHPLSQARINLLAQRVASSPARGRATAEDTRYWHARMRAKLRGFLDNPLTTLQQVSASDRSEIAVLTRAIAYHRALDAGAALREVDALLSLRPNDPYYWELKGQILFEGGDARQAVPAYQKAVSLAPGETLLQVAYARALLALGDRNSDTVARDALLAATRQDRLDADAWRQLATAQSRLGDRGGATLSTAEFQALQGSLKAAERNARSVQETAPTGSPAWLRAGDIIAEVERAQANQ